MYFGVRLSITIDAPSPKSLRRRPQSWTAPLLIAISFLGLFPAALRRHRLTRQQRLRAQVRIAANNILCLVSSLTSRSLSCSAPPGLHAAAVKQFQMCRTSCLTTIKAQNMNLHLFHRPSVWCLCAACCFTTGKL